MLAHVDEHVRACCWRVGGVVDHLDEVQGAVDGAAHPIDTLFMVVRGDYTARSVCEFTTINSPAMRIRPRTVGPELACITGD